MTGVFLLDVNILIAMMWPAHEAHARVQQWLRHHSRDTWATCPLTQTAFVRIVSNPAFSPHALTPGDASALLQANLDHPSHVFWPDNVSFAEATEPLRGRILGHKQVTDAYLLGLAMHRSGRLVTLDKAMAALLGEKAIGTDAIALI